MPLGRLPSAHGPIDFWRSSSFLVRFTVTGLALTLVTGAALGWTLGRFVEETTLEGEAQRVAEDVPRKIAPELHPSDFTGALTPDRTEAIDRVIRDRILDQHIVRVKLWAPNGTILYSDDRSLTGQRFPVEDELEQALHGKVAKEVSELDKSENESERDKFARLMEIYVPIRLGNAGVVGVFEAYRDLGPVEAQIATLRGRLWLSLGLAFAAFYTAMFGLVSRASRDLRRHNEQLQAEIRERQAAQRARLESEARLHQAQKMEAVGRLAGTMAHDFNNLLAAMVGFASLLEGCDRLMPKEQGWVNEIIRAGERASSLTRQLLAFGRRQVLRPQVLDLNQAIEDIGPLVDRATGNSVRLVLQPSDAPAWVSADPGQVEQVVLNLAVNARDAMPHGGDLIVQVSPVALDQNFATGHPGVHFGDYVELTVTDTGSGIDAETRGHIFEPFFTTKAPGEGTGLGLASVYGIVNQSGGAIAVESAVGQGTTFRIYLPRISAPKPADANTSLSVPAA